LEDRKLNQARSKADLVDRPVRTARTNVNHGAEYSGTETVRLIDQHDISDMGNWR